MKIFTVVLATLLTLAVMPARAADEPSEAAPAERAASAGKPRYFERAGELVIHALSLIGVSYKYGGNSADRGLDCSGLVSLVFHEVAGLVLPRSSRDMSKVGKQVDQSKLEPGDLVFFNTRKQPYSHVGIYIGEARFVHSPSPGRDVEVANMHEAYWQKRYNGARRVSF